MIRVRIDEIWYKTLVTEMAHAGEDHGDAGLVGGGNDLLIVHHAARLTIVKLLLEVLLDSPKFFDRCTDIRTVDDVNLYTFANSR